MSRNTDTVLTKDMSEAELTELVAARKRQAAEADAKAREISRVKDKLKDLRHERDQLESRRRRFLDLVGDDHIEHTHSMYDERFGVLIEYEALRSRLTGTQLAKKTERLIVDVDAAITPVERQLEELLAS